MPAKIIDKFPKKFGKLLAVTEGPRNKHNVRQYQCICSCGISKLIPLNRLRYGRQTSCGCSKFNTGSNHKSWKGPLQCTYNDQKRAARKRKINWELTIEDFKKLIESNCHYCNSEPKLHNSRDIKIVRNGVDRVNSSGSYSLKNCVSCCFNCNIMKFTHSIDEFLAHVHKIYNNSVIHDRS